MSTGSIISSPTFHMLRKETSDNNFNNKNNHRHCHTNEIAIDVHLQLTQIDNRLHKVEFLWCFGGCKKICKTTDEIKDTIAINAFQKCQLKVIDEISWNDVRSIALH